MLRVTVEMIPFGDESKAHEIGRVTIINNKKGDKDFGAYEYAVSDDRGTLIVGNHRHMRIEGFWRLLYDILFKSGVADSTYHMFAPLFGIGNHRYASRDRMGEERPPKWVTDTIRIHEGNKP